MKPSIGGPHWNVRSGCVLDVMPSRPTSAVIRPCGGAHQARRVSIRILVSSPIIVILLIAIVGWLALARMWFDEPPVLFGRVPVVAVRSILISLGLKSK